jgi:hypothetical protein
VIRVLLCVNHALAVEADVDATRAPVLSVAVHLTEGAPLSTEPDPLGAGPVFPQKPLAFRHFLRRPGLACLRGGFRRRHRLPISPARSRACAWRTPSSPGRTPCTLSP